jgi:hypothetical protein
MTPLPEATTFRGACRTENGWLATSTHNSNVGACTSRCLQTATATSKQGSQTAVESNSNKQAWNLNCLVCITHCLHHDQGPTSKSRARLLCGRPTQRTHQVLLLCMAKTAPKTSKTHTLLHQHQDRTANTSTRHKYQRTPAHVHTVKLSKDKEREREETWQQRLQDKSDGLNSFCSIHTAVAVPVGVTSFLVFSLQNLLHNATDMQKATKDLSSAAS